MLPRKIIAASLAGSLFSILFGLVAPNPFGEDISSIEEYIWGFVTSTPIYLIYSFPVILIYGTLTSMVSDFIAKYFSVKTLPKLEFYISGLLHLLFGLVLLWISLFASILYFLTDRLLKQKFDNFKWGQAFKSLIFPLLVWILFFGIIWFVDFKENWTNYIVYFHYVAVPM